MPNALQKISFDLTTLRAHYLANTVTVTDIVKEVYRRGELNADNPLWILKRSQTELLKEAAQLDALSMDERATLPLFGIPFAVKDNIDVAGLPTTAACPAFCYTPSRSASVITRLQQAGAILIGKTNLDQFATGLNGTRSPYGICHNAFDSRYISGGSSSGSALAVATGQVSFALGTDTAGSGRVPAAFNNVIGLKPSRGLISTSGVVPACRSLDCVSVFAMTCWDGWWVLQNAQGYDVEDSFSRFEAQQIQKKLKPFCFGVPHFDQLDFHADAEARDLYIKSIQRLEALGGLPITIDISVFTKTAKLLYEGPWLVERAFATAPVLNREPQAVHPVIRDVLEKVDHYTAKDVFEGIYQLEQLKSMTRSQWQQMDVLLLPTTPTIFTIEAMLQDPIKLNAKLGIYTNFVNLLDLSALAVPAGFHTNGLPFGVSLIAPALHDDWLCALGAAYHQVLGGNLGATIHSLSLTPNFQSLPPAEGTVMAITALNNESCGAMPVSLTPTPSPGGRGGESEKSLGATFTVNVEIAVVGAHLSEQPLNHQLTDRGAKLVATTRTAPVYRLYALATQPAKPGLVRVNQEGKSIEVEVWSLPVSEFGSFVAEVAPPLAIGSLVLEDQRCIKGFICEPLAIEQAQDITRYGGWRRYLASLHEVQSF